MIGCKSVMIMAVSLRLMLAAAVVVALSGCGERGKQEQSVAPEAKGAPAPQPPKADTRPVIAAYGDSLTAGLGLDPGQSYPDDLQRLIDAAGYKYRVVN